MCGIAGVYSLTDRPPDPEWGRILTRALRHRGPDGEGVYHDSRIVLAHTRLAIIDLSEGGKQPMLSADGRHVIVTNGEIYNYRELRARAELEERAAFRSTSDTEVLLHVLGQRGTEGLSSLLGMFAFAWYDRESSRLLLARDRLGKKPLIYARTGEWLAFASEAAALLQLSFVRRRLDQEALWDYERFLYVPAPATLIEGVRKLPPGSHLTIDPSVVGPPVRYWSLPQSGSAVGTAAPSSQALEHDLDELLLDATRLRTVSDVPIGLFQSGGIDSNAILESLHRVGHRPIRAFTVGFSGMEDERPLAREAARRLADEHVEIELRPDVAQEVPAILKHFGEPLGDSAIVTTYVIAREASKHVKVILNGDGGDELFGGYPRYPFARRLDLAASVPAGLACSRRLYARRRYLDEFFESMAERKYSQAAERLSSVMTPSQESVLLDGRPGGSNGASSTAARLAPWIPAEPPGSLTAALFEWDTRSYLPDDLLTKVDLASMAHALENRSPFLDHRFFERVAPLPMSLRTHPFRTKPLLRKMMRNRLPRAIVRARKQGFQLPLDSWLRGPLRPWLDGLLGNPEATGELYRGGALRGELERFHAGASDPNAPYRLWGLAVLELWAREFNVEVAT